MKQGVLARLRANDQAAWAELYDSLAPELRAYIKRLGGSSPDDILGDTMVSVVRDIRRFTGTDDELRPWIFRIAHNRVIDSARRRGSRPVEVGVDIEADALEPYMPLTAAPSLAELSHLLEGLTLDQRSVVWLRYVTNLSLDDVAMVMGKTNEAVAALTHRALRQLRNHLSDLDF